MLVKAFYKILAGVQHCRLVEGRKSKLDVYQYVIMGLKVSYFSDTLSVISLQIYYSIESDKIGSKNKQLKAELRTKYNALKKKTKLKYIEESFKEFHKYKVCVVKVYLRKCINILIAKIRNKKKCRPAWKHMFMHGYLQACGCVYTYMHAHLYIQIIDSVD